MTWVEIWLENARQSLGAWPLDGSPTGWIVVLFSLAVLQFCYETICSLHWQAEDGPSPAGCGHLSLPGSGDARWSTAKHERGDCPRLTVAAASPTGTRTYQLGRRLARGDLCDVYYAECGGAPFLIKTSRAAAAEQLLWKEREVLEQLLDKPDGCQHRAYFPWPVETFQADGRWANAFRWREGFCTSERIKRRRPGRQPGGQTGGLPVHQLVAIFQSTLRALGYAHRRGWVHGAVFPPHLLCHTELDRLQLIDWIHAEQLDGRLRIASRRFRRWYPAECQDRGPAEPSTDIYLAAKSMVYLAGGDPLRKTMPDRIPRAIQRFFAACLLESPNMRPQDAWLLHDEFTALCQPRYGRATITA